MFTQESLQNLREKIDLLEVLSGHIDIKRTGSSYKALCPFHSEKTPSFMIQKGDTHYHCFGCGAHGDAIQFLMNYLNLSFYDAVEALAEKFHVPLQRVDGHNEQLVNKTALKEACTLASEFYQSCLLYTEEGKIPLNYLYQRGISIDFIRRFGVGFAPHDGSLFRQFLKEKKISDELAVEAGLFTSDKRPFFWDRITFPIHTATGQVIGFSARKFKEETGGGKYINTHETSLFKKSRILFGLNYCRRRIAKERRVIVVEGQIDCLKLIEAGLNATVAALGTAFGEVHVEELKKLGVREAFLLFDADDAGRSAASKSGDLLQKKGIDVSVVTLPKGSDPDSYLAQFGIERLLEEFEKKKSYLEFQIAWLSKEFNVETPAGKAELIKTLKKQIELWEDRVMVHEALRKIAHLLQMPLEMVGLKGNAGFGVFVKNRGALAHQEIDTERILELDLLRWLILMKEKALPIAQEWLTEEHFWNPSCRSLYLKILEEDTSDFLNDTLSWAGFVEDPMIIDQILQRKVKQEKAEPLFKETVQKLLDRQWLKMREEANAKINRGTLNERELLELTKQFATPRTLIDK